MFHADRRTDRSTDVTNLVVGFFQILRTQPKYLLHNSLLSLNIKSAAAKFSLICYAIICLYLESVGRGITAEPYALYSTKR